MADHSLIGLGLSASVHIPLHRYTGLLLGNFRFQCCFGYPCPFLANQRGVEIAIAEAKEGCVIRHLPTRERVSFLGHSQFCLDVADKCEGFVLLASCVP